MPTSSPTILRWAFAYLQRDGDGEPDERTWLRDETGGSVYLRLSTRSLDQPKRDIGAGLAQAIIDGAYWLREPGPNAQIVVAYQGAVAPEAIEAVGLMGEDRRDVGLLAVTSADRLNAGWTAAQRARERGLVHAQSHIERLLSDCPAALRAGDGARRASRRRSPGSAPCAAIARARSASSISARAARSPISTAITAWTRRRSSAPRKRSRRAARSAIWSRSKEGRRPAAQGARERTLQPAIRPGPML